MKITATAEYSMQALLLIADSTRRGKKLSAQEISNSQGIPQKFLEKQLSVLRQAGFISAERGSKGGYTLAIDAQEIYVADVFRAVEGPLAAVSDKAPELAKYKGVAVHLTEVWIATRVSLRNVLEKISLQDILDGEYPGNVSKMIEAKDAWKRR